MREGDYVSAYLGELKKYCKAEGHWSEIPIKKIPPNEYYYDGKNGEWVGGGNSYTEVGDGRLFYVKDIANSSADELYLVAQDTAVFTAYNPPSFDRKQLEEKGYEALALNQSTSTQYVYPETMSVT